MPLGDRDYVIIGAMTADGLLAGWCGVGAIADREVASTLLLAAQRQLSLTAVQSSATERRWQVESGRSAATAAFAVAAVEAYTGDAAEAVRIALTVLKERGFGIVERFQQVADTWKGECRRIVVDAGADLPSMADTVQMLAQVIEAAPRIQVEVRLAPDEWMNLRQRLGEHAAAVLEPHVLLTAAAASSPAPAARRREPVSPPREAAARLAAIRSEAAAAVRAAREQAIRTSQVPSSSASPEQQRARSLAEALLHAALEADPRTTGLFALNADGGFQFGLRPAEIDLLCQSLRIAIEVDGYFHFQNTDAYRRDRDKDRLMQRHGLWVLRFLAEDVAGELERIIATIAESVAIRRGLHDAESSG
jgi:very-short-patch-repair endonuclease